MKTLKNKIKMERAVIDKDLIFTTFKPEIINISMLNIMEYMFSNEYTNTDNSPADYQRIIFDENGLKICKYYRFNLYSINDFYISTYYFKRIIINAISKNKRRNKIIAYFSKRLNLEHSFIKDAFSKVAILEKI